MSWHSFSFSPKSFGKGDDGLGLNTPTWNTVSSLSSLVWKSVPLCAHLCKEMDKNRCREGEQSESSKVVFLKPEWMNRIENQGKGRCPWPSLPPSLPPSNDNNTAPVNHYSCHDQSFFCCWKQERRRGTLHSLTHKLAHVSLFVSLSLIVPYLPPSLPPSLVVVGNFYLKSWGLAHSHRCIFICVCVHIYVSLAIWFILGLILSTVAPISPSCFNSDVCTSINLSIHSFLCLFTLHYCTFCSPAQHLDTLCKIIFKDNQKYNYVYNYIYQILNCFYPLSYHDGCVHRSSVSTFCINRLLTVHTYPLERLFWDPWKTINK